ncbi:CBU_0592 family membrane protein [Halarcobacter bivalviorum]|uniref:Membrane protein n=1 Tax=Halarcobacter bivalviorum TaxID=663364 RepID=A0AAX2AB83_9BACT|nr:hypothetical protein [Halarcobacter bivalviorum]AXH11740.1 putative membrane protein [Halarcobacter bivalviorum]RXK07339.1 hypothetical protein CRU97_02815 [Halarcobacter bivalviorum]RXK11403.1 hypothetical protein CRV05_00420 [Halarcobacter bivalviorum]
MDIYQFIGFVGMLFVVLAYFLLQTNKYTISSLPYQVLNLVGAILLFISLCVHFNLGSFIIEVFWILITLYGMYTNLKRKKSEA